MSGPAFHYSRAGGLDDALAQGSLPDAVFLAGGTDLLQLWKSGIATPAHVIDISRLPLNEIKFARNCLTLGALARLSDVASHPDVAQHHPLIAEAILASASGQVRNMATLGGNLLQRTRCPYFRGQNFDCNKRAPGSGCGALTGENRQAALFGTSAACVATHASDLAVALAALAAEVDILGPAGVRRVTLTNLYCLPDATPARETTLGPGELITAVSVQNAFHLSNRSTYLKVRDRASFEFAVVSVAAALRIEDGVIAEAQLAAGGVAPLPWRLVRCEAALIGSPPTTETFSTAADMAIEGAQLQSHNGFKVRLLRNAVIRALQTVGGQP